MPTTTRPEHDRGTRSRAGAANGGEQPAPLGKSGTAFHPAPPESCEPRNERQTRRSEKFQFRQSLRQYAQRKTVQLCGSRACSASGVGIRLTESESGPRAGFAGLSTCGSIWLCPVCAAKIAARRAEELSTVLENVRDTGYQLAMVTLTVRHSSKDSLKDVWSAVGRGWHRVTGGKAWLADKKHYDIPGWVKAVEVTHGRNGWHVHVHTVIAYKDIPKAATALGQRIYGRWESGLKETKKHKGFTALPGYGIDVQVSEGGDLGNLGKYLSKLGADLRGLSREMTQGGQKQARSKNRTPFQIGRDLIDTESSRDGAIWDEWQTIAPGHRAITWAKGFREQFGLNEAEATDEEIAAEEFGTEDDTVCLIPSPAWYGIKHRACEILDVAENRGAEALKAWLDDQGIDWTPAPDRFKRADDVTPEENRAVKIGRAMYESGRKSDPRIIDDVDRRRRCFECGEAVAGWLSEHVGCAFVGARLHGSFPFIRQHSSDPIVKDSSDRV